MKPLEVDLKSHGGLREIRKKIKDFESAWARLQHDAPGYTLTAEDSDFERDLLAWLKFHKGMLIGEVISQLYNYLKSNPLASERIEYEHILVDEYQDLNKAEQGVITLLSDNAEMCIVGDDDQSIYSFKNAHPDGIRDWITINPLADDLTLLDCRRCPTIVTEMANSLIGHNTNRTIPRLLTPIAANGPGNVKILQYQSLDYEIHGVASIISNLISDGTKPGCIIVLAQRGIIGTPIYNSLRDLGIPTKSYYAEAELDAEDAQRRFAILKLFINKEDRAALRWLLGYGSSNWRSPSYFRVRQYCEQNNETPWKVLEELAAGRLSISYTNPIIKEFENIKTEIEVLETLSDIGQVVDHILPSTDQSIQELRALAVQIIDANNAISPKKFLEELTTAIAKPEIPDEIEDVRIMSLHKSKGLSAPVTIIAGCIDGLLPKQPDSSLAISIQEAQLEEQRRLFFVGISRVKASPSEGEPGTLILTYSQEMPLAAAMGAGITPASVQYGIAHLHASRFIRELGPSAPSPVAG